MNDVVLPGCTATPLASYLKALGVLRLLSTADAGAKAFWRNDTLTLRTEFSVDQLENFFSFTYRPTPVMAPWNGGSGFYDNDNRTAMRVLLDSSDARVAHYRDCLHVAEEVLGNLDRSSSPKDAAKVNLLTRLRGELPETALEWFDACVVLSDGSARYPPLLGTGGNDGRLDFTNNFMQRLVEALNLTSEDPTESSAWLRMALHGQTAPHLVKRAIGQFSPGQAGGPNAASGFSADSLINPWDYVLMIEGALAFAAAVVRRNADDPEGVQSFPFTVRAVGAGAGGLGGADAGSSRGELWMPLWGRPASYAEVRGLLAEGRVALGRKPAKDALDFVRAVHRLGGYRGVDRFQRFGLLMRSGKAYLATPLAQVVVARNPKSSWLDELDQRDWLTRFRRFAQGDAVAARFLRLRRRLEDAMFDVSGRQPSAPEGQALITLLGEIQMALSASRKARESVPPLPLLSEQWTEAGDDGSTAFRIAKALAGLRGFGPVALPLRAQLFPIHPERGDWMEVARKAPGAANDPFCRLRLHDTPVGALPGMLSTLLRRRLWLADQLGMPDRPLGTPAPAQLDDIVAFLSSDGMDRRISSVLPGLSLCRVPADASEPSSDTGVPAAFALLSLCLTPASTLRRLELLGLDETLSTPGGLVAQLEAGNVDNRAVRLAWRRLRASGLSPVHDARALPQLVGIDPRRAAGALLIPVRPGSARTLARSVLDIDQSHTA